MQVQGFHLYFRKNEVRIRKKVPDDKAGADIRPATESQVPDLPTDGFSSWLALTLRAHEKDEGAEVPCGDCRGCCTSSYFIHIRPQETETLARIPKGLVFPAPGLPKGHVLLGYDKNGHCPMFKNNGCSIYAHRPQTCRNYDCRIFPATGLTLGGEKPLISGQADRWRFDLSAPGERELLRAVRAAAKFLVEQAHLFPPGFVPANPTQQAAIAIKAHTVFLFPKGGTGKNGKTATVREIADAVVAAYRGSVRAERPGAPRPS